MIFQGGGVVGGVVPGENNVDSDQLALSEAS